MPYPMLATPSHEPFNDAALRYVNDPRWGLDVKVDGVRLLVGLQGDGPFGFNRSGARVALPRALTWSLTGLLAGAGSANAYLDGELVGDLFWVFDLIQPNRPDPWVVRRLSLDNLLAQIGADPAVMRPVPSAFERGDKAELVMRIRREGLEGLIAKELNSPYLMPAGKSHRSKHWLKLKDVKTVDCVVTRLGVDGKANMAVALWRDRDLTEVGEVSALTGDGPRVVVGDVVTITFLYLGVNDRLVQPVTPRLRTDKTAAECTWEQLPPSPGELA